MAVQSVFVALLGIAVAGGSAYGAKVYLIDQNRAQQQAQADADASLSSVVVASRDISFGEAIEPSMVQTIVWPTKALPPGAMRELNKVLPVQGQPARRATHSIAAGEILLASKLSEYGGKVTIVQSLADNARAMAIQVNASTAVGGFVTPGDRVDIILTQGRDANLRALTILQNIRVIGVDQDANPNRDKPEVARTVTVEVSPEQGQTLALAQNAGTLSLALRTAHSGSDKPLEAIRLSDVLRDRSPVPAAQTPKKTTILVRRGTETKEVEVN